jgi:hypothetical protein
MINWFLISIINFNLGIYYLIINDEFVIFICLSLVFLFLLWSLRKIFLYNFFFIIDLIYYYFYILIYLNKLIYKFSKYFILNIYIQKLYLIISKYLIIIKYLYLKKLINININIYNLRIKFIYLFLNYTNNINNIINLYKNILINNIIYIKNNILKINKLYIFFNNFFISLIKKNNFYYVS